MPYTYELPAPGTIQIQPQAQRYLDFITENQLLDETLWRRFVSAYKTKADDADRGWRGEYWGKMMRGACLVYRCTKSERLYTVLRQSVEALLEAADADGRLSTYKRENECSGWDLWCRKYVLTGMLHFCDICPDPALVRRILTAMQAHADCIMERVGDQPGQIPITETSDFWLGVNACSILESVLDLYRRTQAPRLLAFAAYIIGTGGCSGGNLIELALQDTVAPYAYPEQKAYETMSFFEGVLAYYEVTNQPRYLDAVKRFVQKVQETEITIIGCAGCTHELFDHAAVRQTEKLAHPSQETCVTVTWMRLCARLFLLTGEEVYADCVERAALNALYGSVNLFLQPVTDLRSKAVLSGMPFDSYSPLFQSRRGQGVGGLKYFSDGTYYGCCACIGAAGLAVYPLTEALRKRAGHSPFKLEEHRLNGKIAFTFGPYALACDTAKEKARLSRPIRPLYDESGALRYTCLPCAENESIRLRLAIKGGSILLTDYASCGKRWADSNSRVTVWIPCRRKA